MTSKGDKVAWIAVPSPEELPAEVSAEIGDVSERIGFLRKVLEEGPADGLEPIDKWQDVRTAGRAGTYYLVYFGADKPTEWKVELPRGGLNDPLTLKAEVLDTWGMTVTPVDEVFELKPEGRYRYTCPDRPALRLPGKPYLAVRLCKARP